LTTTESGTSVRVDQSALLTELRRDNFNTIRLALSIGVLLSHSFAMVGAREPIVMGRTLGNFCVHLFFAISGYMITQSFARTRDITRFTLNRVLRILPALVIVNMFTALLWYRFAISRPIQYRISQTVPYGRFHGK
jgi:peptidoglycan/LPS O-acetylase OafA/YrhL